MKAHPYSLPTRVWVRGNPFPIPGGKREFGRKGTVFNVSVERKSFRFESGKVSGGGGVGNRGAGLQPSGGRWGPRMRRRAVYPGV